VHVGQVDLQADDAAPVALELALRACQPVGAAGRDRHVGARLGQRLGHPAPQPLAAARHQRRLALKRPRVRHQTRSGASASRQVRTHISPIRRWASRVRPPTCGVSTTFGQAEQRAVARRLGGEDVQARAAQAAGGERGGERLLVHERPARRVDQQRAGPHPPELRRAEQGAVRAARRVERHDVAALEELVEPEQAHAALARPGLVGVRVVRAHLQAERLGAVGDLAPDPPDPDDAEGPPAQLDPRRGPPGARGHAGVRADEVPREGQHERERQVGDGVVHCPGRGPHEHAVGLGRLHVDGVEPHAVLGDDLQPRRGGDDLRRQLVRAGDDGVHPRQELEQLGCPVGAAGLVGHDLEPRGPQRLQVLGEGLAERPRPDEDARAHARTPAQASRRATTSAAMSAAR
jgi:hypothetical protein